MYEFDPTAISGFALVFLIVMVALMFSLPRHKAIAALISTAVLMTIGPQIEVAGCHFTIIRLVILAGWIRVKSRRELADVRLETIDRAFLWWIAATVVIGVIPKPVHPEAVIPHTFMSELINKGGFAFDALGAFFLSRCFVRTPEDIRFMTKVLIGLAVVVACFMTVEELTQHNMFSVLGAVPDITVVRNDRFRCQGPFTHPIHAGDFGATLMPLCIGLWFTERRNIAIVGMMAAATIVVESASSGPLMAFVFGSAVFGLWYMRDRMSTVRRLLVAFTILLQLCMKNPVWWAIARISDVVGGGGYWRAKLIDEFVNHFSEWWLIGSNYTAHWSPTGVGLPSYPDMMDLTNQFVAEGVNGGIIKLILYIVILVCCFKKVGRSVHNFSYTVKTRFLYWTLGCTLFAYIVSFIDVANAAQNSVIFYAILASIALTPAAEICRETTEDELDETADIVQPAAAVQYN